MTEQIFVRFPDDIAQLIGKKMKEEGVTDQGAFLSELLIRNLSRRKTSETWGEIIREIITESLDDENEEEEGESTILIFSSDDEE